MAQSLMEGVVFMVLLLLKMEQFTAIFNCIFLINEIEFGINFLKLVPSKVIEVTYIAYSNKEIYW